MDRFIPAFLRTKKINSITIDDISHRIYYRYTVATFIVNFVLGASKQYFGDAIICYKSDNYINQYCWSNSTFIENEDGKIYQNYYQWVILKLFTFIYPITYGKVM